VTLKCGENFALTHSATDEKEVRQLLQRAHTIQLAQSRYIPQPIPVPVYFFAADENKAENKVLQHWESLLPENSFRVSWLSGKHATMLEEPQVKALGRELSQAIHNASGQSASIPEQSYSPLITLKVSQLRKYAAPLFCVPGAGASATCFVDLTSCRDVGWAIHGLQPQGMDGLLVPHSTVQAAAETYLHAVQELHPRGAVHLLGHSFGGWVAFEMAQKLRDTGRGIGSLTIVDSDIPDDKDSAIKEYTPSEITLEWVAILGQKLGRSLGITIGDLELLDERGVRELLHKRLVVAGLMQPKSKPDILRGPLRIFATALRTNYTPGSVFDGPARFVLVDDRKLDFAGNRQRQAEMVAGWRAWIPNLVSSHAPGNHMTVLDSPNVDVLADLLREQREDIH
jgi:thioesterase domain-containing protein